MLVLLVLPPYMLVAPTTPPIRKSEAPPEGREASTKNWKGVWTSKVQAPGRSPVPADLSRLRRRAGMGKTFPPECRSHLGGCLLHSTLRLPPPVRDRLPRRSRTWG